MTLLDFIHPHASQALVATEPGIETSVAPPAVTPVESKAEETPKDATLAPEDIAATTVVEPLKDEVRPNYRLAPKLICISPSVMLRALYGQVNPQPTATHAEAGTAHTETDATAPAETTPHVTIEEPQAAEAVTPAEEVKEEAIDDKQATVKVCLRERERLTIIRTKRRRPKLRVKVSSPGCLVSGSRQRRRSG